MEMRDMKQAYYRLAWALLVALSFPFALFSQPGIGIYADMIYSSADVALFSDLSASDSAQWEINGTLSLNNSASIENSTNNLLFGGTGTLLFQSSEPQSITGNPVSVPNLQLENAAGLLLGTDLKVQDNALINSGNVATGEHTLYIESNDEGALVADASQLSTEYIIGNLSRAVRAGATVEFPVGNADGAHPLVVHNSGGERTMLVSYAGSAGEALECNPDIFYFGYAFNQLATAGIWTVDDSGTDAFEIELYHYNAELASSTQSKYAVATRPKESSCDSWQLTDDADFSTSRSEQMFEDYAHVSHATKSGFYAIVSADKTNVDIANVIKLDGESETRFIIPDVWDYSDNSLQIFSRWGTKVFDGDNYDNTFDFKGLQAGTYFYTFNYTYAGSSREVKSFVEVVKK